MSLKSLLDYGIWLVVPQTATNILSSLLAKSYPPGRAPPPGSSRFVRNRKICSVIVVLTVTVYAVVHHIYGITVSGGNFYELLNVSVTADSKSIRRAFHSLSLQWHPDKRKPELGDPVGYADQIYMALQVASSALTDSTVRFMYDRFGPEVLQSWKPLPKTAAEALMKGFQASIIPHYVVSSGMLAFITLIRPREQGRFWRFYALMVSFILEIYLLTRENTHSLPAVVQTLGRIYPFTIRDLISIVRHSLIHLAFAVIQLSDILIPRLPDPNIQLNVDLSAMESMVKALHAETVNTDNHMTAVLKSQVDPFFVDLPIPSAKIKYSLEQDRALLHEMLKTQLIQQKLHSVPEIQEVMDQVAQAH
ncbi:uncharacterized protein V1516DRAFT_578211 [Lipomyces oligophaga]|uniref:uncharacterized protein n=1 Tax=Lipomyces oligophaga TaxID=45792 RepID=UPI0034CE6C56